MKRGKKTIQVVFSVVFFFVITATSAFGITLDAVYTGASGGNWNTASNWDIAVVPINQGAVTFNVTIPAGKTVVFNVPGNGQINNFNLGDSGTSDAQLTLNTGCNLEILGTANIYDFVYGNGGNFTSVVDTNSLKGTRNRIYALNGSHVTISDTSFVATGLNNTSYTILSCDGSSSVLDLSGMTSLNDGYSIGGYLGTHTVSATNGGVINLSGVTSITGPADDDILSIVLDGSGGSINMGNLANISHAGGQGYTKFNVTGNTLGLPVLTSASFASFAVVSSTVTMPSLTGVSNATFAVSAGGKIEANTSPFTYSSTGLNNTSYTLMSCDDSGSVLDLSGMTSLNDGYSIGGYLGTHTVSATNGGVINLSGLTSITGPNGDEVLNITLDGTGGSINLSSLATITHAGGYGFTKFNVTDNNLSLPALSSTDFVMFTAANSTVTLPTVSTVSNATFAVSGGGKIEANTSPFTYSSTGLNNTSYTLMSCDDSGSVLDLSGMTSLNDGYSIGGYLGTHTVSATNGGVINLSGLTSITGPNGDEVLNITLDGTGGSINLSSLATITHAGGYGFTKFNVTDNNLSLPALSSTDFVMFTAANSTVTLPTVSTVSNATFAVSGGGKIEANTSPFTYSSTGLNNTSYTLMSCDDSGSVLDLSGMTSLNDGYSIGGYLGTHTVSATNGGVINLSGLTSITGPNGDEVLNIVANAGVVNIENWVSLTGGTGSTNVSSINGGEIFVGNLNISSTASFALNNEGFLRANKLAATGNVTISAVKPLDFLEVVGDFNLSNKITLDANTSTIGLGRNYTYTYTDETKIKLKKAVVHCFGPGVQKLEVGGLDVDLLTQLLTNENFGIGQLVLRHCDRPVIVQIVDDVDNGNRASSNPEALYLFGPEDGSDGLRLFSGSILAIGNLNVYAKVDGTLIRLRDLFGPDQNMVAFDEGFIMLGSVDINHPSNMIVNGGFESGTNPPTAVTLSRVIANGSTDINNWSIAGDGVEWCHDALFNDASAGGQLSIDLSGNPAGAGIIRQTITTIPGYRYCVLFDMGFNPLGNVYGQAGLKKLQVSAGDNNTVLAIDSNISPGQWPADPNRGWNIIWQKKSWSFVASATSTTIEFACADNPPSAFGAAVDNVIVIEDGEFIASIVGDIDANDIVNMNDLSEFVSYWLAPHCDSLGGCWCECADFDRDGDVDFTDYALLMQHWLEEQL